MKVLEEYIRYYISGSLREKREGQIVGQLEHMQKTQNISENILRKYVRSIILQHINEVCGDIGDDVTDALATAQMAHLGQKRRSGEPYLTHPVEVANIVYMYYPDDPILCAAALLHDSLEDAFRHGNVESNEDMESLIAGSFGDPSVGHAALRIVRALTHTSGDYTDYIMSISGDDDVLKIKLSDMLHNLQSTPSESQKEKYKKAIQALSPDGIPPHGIDSGHWKALINLTANDNSEE